MRVVCLRLVVCRTCRWIVLILWTWAIVFVLLLLVLLSVSVARFVATVS